MKWLTVDGRGQSGATYVEVLVASLLIMISLVPMTNALRGAIGSTDAFELSVQQQLELTARIEDVLAEPYSSLEAAAIAAGGGTVPSSYSDAPGSQNRRLVYLLPYDGDNADSDDDPFTGADPGLLWIRVEIEGTRLAVESLISK